MFSSKSVRLASLFASLLVAFTMVTVDTAEARRGGSFGSRGTRTFQSAPPTNTVPRQVQPVQRTTTPSTPQTNTTTRPTTTATAPRPTSGFFGSPLMRGLFLGGLFGLFMGYGFGGLGGMMSLLFQILLIGGGIWLIMRLMRSRATPRPAMAGMNHSPYQGMAGGTTSYANQRNGGGGTGRKARNTDELGLTSRDLDRFEKMLSEVQEAYGREDYEHLRRLTTPEMMSYLSQELGENAAKGLRNEVSDVKLLKGSTSEAWREGRRDYATVALRYSSKDATLDRQTGRVVSGDADRVTEATELWTFTRENGGDWKLSAIQEA